MSRKSNSKELTYEEVQKSISSLGWDLLVLGIFQLIAIPFFLLDVLYFETSNTLSIAIFIISSIAVAIPLIKHGKDLKNNLMTDTFQTYSTLRNMLIFLIVFMVIGLFVGYYVGLVFIIAIIEIAISMKQTKDLEDIAEDTNNLEEIKLKPLGSLIRVLTFLVIPLITIVSIGGIVAGRFAVNRANVIAHQSAVANIYEALQAYYADHRTYPEAQTPKLLIEGPLHNYIYYNGSVFMGGTETTYHYFVESAANNQQAVLVCVSMGGINDVNHSGYYCDGNGFGDSKLVIGSTTGAAIDQKLLYWSGANPYYSINADSQYASEWNGSGWSN